MAEKIKLQFKQQGYQTDATMAVVDCFDGQSKGERKEIVARKDLFEETFVYKAVDELIPISENDFNKVNN